MLLPARGTLRGFHAGDQGSASPHARPDRACWPNGLTAGHRHSKRWRGGSRDSIGCAPQKCRPAGVTSDFIAFRRQLGGSRAVPTERRRRLNRVLVVQSVQHGCRSHERSRCPSTSRFNLRGSCRSCGRPGYTGSQRTVRTPAVVVCNPLAQDRAEMRLGQWNHPIQALAPDRADHALADRVRLGARER